MQNEGWDPAAIDEAVQLHMLNHRRRHDVRPQPSGRYLTCRVILQPLPHIHPAKPTPPPRPPVRRCRALGRLRVWGWGQCRGCCRYQPRQQRRFRRLAGSRLGLCPRAQCNMSPGLEPPRHKVNRCRVSTCKPETDMWRVRE